MGAAGFALFETPIGACGIAWTPSGLCGVQLPERDAGSALARLARRFPALAEADAGAVGRAVDAIRSHLEGRSVDYRDVRLDLSEVAAFELSVYRAAQAIPFGETRSYGALAAALGAPQAAQAVGRALGRNPWPIVVPCHRITAADGRTGGFSAPGGAVTKLRLLEIEGALAPDRLPLFAPRQEIR